MTEERLCFQLFADEACTKLIPRLGNTWQLNYGRVEEGHSIEETVYLRNVCGQMEELEVVLSTPETELVKGEITSEKTKTEFEIGEVFPITVKWTAAQSVRAQQYQGRLSVTATLLEEVYAEELKILEENR